MHMRRFYVLLKSEDGWGCHFPVQARTRRQAVKKAKAEYVRLYGKVKLHTEMVSPLTAGAEVILTA